MTVITFICFLIIASLILCVPENLIWFVLICVVAYFVSLFLYAIYEVLYEFFKIRHDTAEDELRKELREAQKNFDYDSVRVIEWNLLPISQRELFVAYYKSRRISALYDTILSDVSQPFKDRARIELGEIDSIYNTNNPPEEWDSSQSVETLY